MAGLNDFLDDGGGEAPGQAEAHEPSAAAAEPAPAVEATPQAPPVADDPPDEIPEDLRGTREALIAERAKRKDWKGQAERAAGELAATKAALEEARKAVAAPPPPPAQAAEPPAPMMVPNPVEDPQGYHVYIQQQLFNDRLNLSEAGLRRHIGDNDDVNAKIEAFKKAVTQNPALRNEMTRHPDPYQYIYDTGKKMLALAEVGDDPAAFRTKLEAEIRAKVEAEYAAAGGGAMPAARPVLNIPRSLGTAPSSAPRSSPTEAPAFEDIFTPRRKRA